MLKEIHNHIVHELQQSARTDTVFVISAILFNLIVLGINWGVAADVDKEGGRPPESDFILIIMIVAVIVINLFSVRALKTGSDTRRNLLTGLMKMYEDNDVDKYYDVSLLGAYSQRYRLFMAVLVILSLIAVVVPLIARFVG
jgi:hypothetical protein